MIIEEIQINWIMIELNLQNIIDRHSDNLDVTDNQIKALRGSSWFDFTYIYIYIYIHILHK